MIIEQICLILVAVAIPPARPQTVSPCPGIFKYESTTEGAWNGVITLTSDTKLLGVTLTVILDNKAHLLGTDVAAVTTSDNTNYQIENSQLELSPGTPVPVKFFVRYAELRPAPKLLFIRLNGREICNFNSKPEEIRITTETLVQEVTSEIRPEAQCGKVTLNRGIPLILGGRPTLEGQWPWQIALYHSEETRIAYQCGGTLISHSHVITAAHCVTTRSSRQPYDENTLTVYLGKHNLKTSTQGVQIRLVNRITVHPDYFPSNFSRDVSILTLREPVTYTDWVRPACLWPSDLVDLSHVIGKSGSVVGWGYDSSGRITDELNLAEMPVVSQEMCIRSYSEFFGKVTSDYTYCAGNLEYIWSEKTGKWEITSVCNGDSGGGMVFESGSTWYLRGLVSVAAKVKNENICDPTHYVVFTDLAKVLPWIYDNVHSF